MGQGLLVRRITRRQGDKRDARVRLRRTGVFFSSWARPGEDELRPRGL
jgi:hypothetical protein